MTALGENRSLCAVETLADGRKRHLPEKSVERIKADIVVIGGGAAGCFAAIKAREAGADRVSSIDLAAIFTQKYGPRRR
ncbi:MAG: FAD-binding protein [Deltaproteobacteria bacterium]|nr:FAD-binding protein [Deltaproteobacteria bacterium]MBW2139092.1 FAD-binding protein [Deltaproteobacteria bacterium]